MGRENLVGRGAFGPLLVECGEILDPCGLKMIFMNENVSKEFDSKFLEKVEFQVQKVGNGMNEAKFCEEVTGEPSCHL